MSNKESEGILDLLSESRKKTAKEAVSPAMKGMWNSVVNKYSDKGHFALELIQNADDAGAKHIRISVANNTVLFIHDGTEKLSVTSPKEETDGIVGHINAMTSVGRSTKENGEIGRFGLGFKSLFALTDRVHIEDDNFSFDITDYIVPTRSERIFDSTRNTGETLFSFTTSDMSAIGLKDIFSPLSFGHSYSRPFSPLMFLRNVVSIEWSDNDSHGSFSKENDIKEYNPLSGNLYIPNTASVKKTNISILSLHTKYSSEVNIDTESKYILVEGASLFKDRENTTQIALPVNENLVYEPIENTNEDKDDGFPIYVYFPTKTESKLPFAVNAPFPLDDSREHIKTETEEFNYISKQCAVLISILLQCYHIVRNTNGSGFMTAELVRDLPYKGMRKGRLYSDFANVCTETLVKGKVFWSDGMHKNDAVALCLDSPNYYTIVLREIGSDIKIADFSLSIKDNSILKFYSKIFKDRIFTAPALAYIVAQNANKLSEYELSDLIKTLIPYKRKIERAAQGNRISEDPITELLYIPFIPTENGLSALYSKEYKNVQTLFYESFVEDQYIPVPSSNVLNDKEISDFIKSVTLSDKTDKETMTERQLRYTVCNRNSYDEYELSSLSFRFIVSDYVSLGMDFEAKREYTKYYKDTICIPCVNGYGEKKVQKPSEVVVKSDNLANLISNDVYVFDNDVVSQYIKPEYRESMYMFLFMSGASFSLPFKQKKTILKGQEMESYLKRRNIQEQIDADVIEIEETEVYGVDINQCRNNIDKSKSLYSLLEKLFTTTTPTESNSMFSSHLVFYTKRGRIVSEKVVFGNDFYYDIVSIPWLFSKDGLPICINDIRNSTDLSPTYDSLGENLLRYFRIPIIERKNIIDLSNKEQELINLLRNTEVSIDSVIGWIKNKK